jgi:hypothetical protein
MEEQVQPPENAVSFACSSLLMSEHHHCSEEVKEKKEHESKKDEAHTHTQGQW